MQGEISRVILVVLDGLRADAIDTFGMTHLESLIRAGSYTVAAETVAPSVTAAAMTSLLTGVPPSVHGVRSDRFHIPSRSGPVDPVPATLAAAGIPTFAFIRQLPRWAVPLAQRTARRLAVAECVFQGTSAAEIVVGAQQALRAESRGLFVMHWPDADEAGHSHGWMSAAYGAAARRLDAALGLLAGWTDVLADPGTLLIALADHGGGGVLSNNHDSDHPHDRTIPIVVAGGRVNPGPIQGPVSLLDVPATILAAMGVAVPASYTGRPLHDTIAPPVDHVVAVA